MKAHSMPSLATVKDLAKIRFSPRMNRRLHKLLDKNSGGTITKDEYEEMSSLVELSEVMGLFKAQALLLLGEKPSVR